MDVQRLIKTHATRRLLPRLPRNASLFRFCRWYVNRWRGENCGDFYLNGEHALMRRLLPQCQLVFDVGGNLGDWTAAAKAFNSESQFHVFEPDPELYNRLQERFLTCQLVVTHASALGDAPGESELFVDVSDRGMNSLYDRKYVTQAERKTIRTRVQLSTLDHEIETLGWPVVDFLKIDVEGHELAVMRGALLSLAKRRITTIQFEYGGCWLDSRHQLRDMWELLEPHGFSLYKLHDNGPQRVKYYLQDLENYHYSNWVATLRKDL